MALTPKLHKPTAPSNPYKGRWGWWYSSIADYMLANPGARLADIAAHVNRGPQTISYIINTDMFRRYFEQRRNEMQAATDAKISHKLAKIGELGLDLMYERLEKKRDAVPINALREITESALDRLGYSPTPSQQGSVNVNFTQNNNSVAVSVDILEEARQTLRRAEQNRAATPSISPTAGFLELEAASVAQASSEGEEG